MGKATFTSDRRSFNKKNDSFIDMVMAHMAMDVEVAIKTSTGTPVKTGGMKAEVRHFKTNYGKWRVEADKEYTAAQEAGIRLSGPGAPTAPFEHYTTSGTSAGWFGRAIMGMLKNREQYILEAKKAVYL